MGRYAMTGGATGIGAAIKARLLGDGHDVIVVDIKEADIRADLSSSGGRAGAVEEINRLAHDGLDGFIACAGLGAHVPDRALTTGVNYFGATELVDGVKDLVAQRKGAIVIVSSNSAPMSPDPKFVELLLDNQEEQACQHAATLPGHAVYSGTKMAVTRWMRRNNAAYAALGVRMNAVAPGFTKTPLSDATFNDPDYGDAIRQFVDSIPLGRPGMPEDIADATCYLLSDAASFVSGSVLFVDGGHDAMLRADTF